jgi:hypothetical protein
VAMVAIPAMAANEVVAYTDNSSFNVGGTVKADELKTEYNMTGFISYVLRSVLNFYYYEAHF